MENKFLPCWESQLNTDCEDFQAVLCCDGGKIELVCYLQKKTSTNTKENPDLYLHVPDKTSAGTRQQRFFRTLKTLLRTETLKTETLHFTFFFKSLIKVMIYCFTVVAFFYSLPRSAPFHTEERTSQPTWCILGAIQSTKINFTYRYRSIKTIEYVLLL